MSSALKDIFTYVGETAMSGAPIRLDFGPVGAFVCQGAAPKFTFAPQFAGTFEEHSRPITAPSRGGDGGGYNQYGHSMLRPASSGRFVPLKNFRS